MAAVGSEAEYESDPEDAILPSALRRREASDDEDEGSDDGGDRKERAGAVGSDGESDGQGAAPAYEVEDDDEELEEEDEIVEGVEVGGDEEEVDQEKDLEVSGEVGEKKEEDEEKKENEPFAVPTAGAFYMHDDRFQENGRGRHRRMIDGRRLWESKDDRAWVHDRFEEMNLKGSHYDEGRRNSRGRFRGRGGGRGRGTGRGYVRANRPRGNYDDADNQNRAQKTVRGRGPRRYDSLPKNDEVLAYPYRQPGKFQESISNTSGARPRPSPQTSNVQPDPPLPRKQVFASSLNSASPPFYPSSSSKEDISVTQKRVTQSGNTIKSQTVAPSEQMESAFLTSQSGSLLRGKSVVDSAGHDKLYINDSMHPVAGRTLTNAQVQSSGSPLASLSAAQSAQSRVQGRNTSINAPSNFQTTSTFNQGARVSAQIQPPVQHRPQTQTTLQISTQQVGQQKSTPGSQVSSPPYVRTNSAEVGDADSLTGSGKSKTQPDGKGKLSNKGPGRGSFLYGGAQIIGASGAIGLNQNDQNFSATPTLLPVMQFGGQHHGGLGVPAVGMAFPGYMAQPQLGLGNSEMTWVPVLAGAAGALGASYPYIALDGSYYPHSSGQTSSSVASSKESSMAKPVNTLKAPQRPEIINDEYGQRPNKPRRYSEMNFGQ